MAQTVNASTCSVFILAGAHFAQTAPNVEFGQAFKEALLKQIVYPNSLRRQENFCQGQGIGFRSGHGSPRLVVAERNVPPGSHCRAMDLWRIDWPFAPTRWCCKTEGKSCEQVAKVLTLGPHNVVQGWMFER